MIHQVKREIAGRTLIIETGRLAKQANGAVLVSYGDTVVLVTACASKAPRAGIDFFPLTVDYEERLYAVGRIPGSWARREGRASEKATLSARVTDRALRPLFPDGFRNDVQIVVIFLLTGCSITSPCCSRSSGTYAIPALIASKALPGFTFFPSTKISPSSGRFIPKSERTNSVLPEPISPVILTISPLWTFKSISL